MEHTQEKWVALQKNLGLGHKGNIIIATQELIDSDIPWIADCGYTEQSEANARRICHCVNNFDEVEKQRDDLLEACKRIKERCDSGGLISKETTGLYNCLEQALARAERGEK